LVGGRRNLGREVFFLRGGDLGIELLGLGFPTLPGGETLLGIKQERKKERGKTSEKQKKGLQESSVYFALPASRIALRVAESPTSA